MENEKEMKAFAKAYSELCKKYGYQLAAVPAFKLRDDGTFSVVIQVVVQKAIQEEVKKDDRI